MDPVVFFDGSCPWCGGFVGWVCRRDRRGRFSFAPLEGQYARGYFSPEWYARPRSEWEMAFWDGTRLWKGSCAALKVLEFLGFPWSVLSGLGFCFPRVLREFVYRRVAAWRPTGGEYCSLPSQALRGKLLN